VLEKDEKSFIENIEESKKFFAEEAEKWQIYTDKIIFLLAKQREKLEKNIWKKIYLENIYSREKINWILEKVENWKIFLENWNILELDKWEIF
jgi:hypothetical protein